ncbi:hypothetical protein ACWIUD_01790 [Helicobacter sp. 23-1044]
MRKLCLIMAIFVSFAFGEKVTISDRIFGWEAKDDKNKVILNVKGNNKRIMSEELVVGCIKYYKKKKRYRIGEEIKYYVRYSDNDDTIADCNLGDSDRDASIYNIIIRWYDKYSVYHFRAWEDKQTKKLEIELIDADWL